VLNADAGDGWDDGDVDWDTVDMWRFITVSVSVIINLFCNDLKLTMQSPCAAQPGYAHLASKSFIAGKSFSVQQKTGPVIAGNIELIIKTQNVWVVSPGGNPLEGPQKSEFETGQDKH